MADLVLTGCTNCCPTIKYYCQSTSTGVICPVTGASNNQDLLTTVGSGTSAFDTSAGVYAVKQTWEMPYTGPTGSYKVSLNVTGIAGAGTTYRFRMQVFDVFCAVLFSTAYTGDLTATGIQTLTDTITWPVGGIGIRISVEAKKVGGLPGLVTVTDDADSYLELL